VAGAAPLIGDEFALTTPRGAWIATYIYAYMAVLEPGLRHPPSPRHPACPPIEQPPSCK
jgi:hypothetical protein